MIRNFLPNIWAVVALALSSMASIAVSFMNPNLLRDQHGNIITGDMEVPGCFEDHSLPRQEVGVFVGTGVIARI